MASTPPLRPSHRTRRPRTDRSTTKSLGGPKNVASAGTAVLVSFCAAAAATTTTRYGPRMVPSIPAADFGDLPRRRRGPGMLRGIGGSTHRQREHPGTGAAASAGFGITPPPGVKPRFQFLHDSLSGWRDENENEKEEEEEDATTTTAAMVRGGNDHDGEFAATGVPTVWATVSPTTFLPTSDGVSPDDDEKVARTPTAWPTSATEIATAPPTWVPTAAATIVVGDSNDNEKVARTPTAWPTSATEIATAPPTWFPTEAGTTIVDDPDDDDDEDVTTARPTSATEIGTAPPTSFPTEAETISNNNNDDGDDDGGDAAPPASDDDDGTTTTVTAWPTSATRIENAPTWTPTAVATNRESTEGPTSYSEDDEDEDETEPPPPSTPTPTPIPTTGFPTEAPTGAGSTATPFAAPATGVPTGAPTEEGAVPTTELPTVTPPTAAATAVPTEGPPTAVPTGVPSGAPVPVLGVGNLGQITQTVERPTRVVGVPNAKHPYQGLLGRNSATTTTTETTLGV